MIQKRSVQRNHREYICGVVIRPHAGIIAELSCQRRDITDGADIVHDHRESKIVNIMFAQCRSENIGDFIAGWMLQINSEWNYGDIGWVAGEYFGSGLFQATDGTRQ